MLRMKIIMNKNLKSYKNSSQKMILSHRHWLLRNLKFRVHPVPYAILNIKVKKMKKNRPK